jgi:hypothetical protein
MRLCEDFDVDESIQKNLEPYGAKDSNAALLPYQ